MWSTLKISSGAQLGHDKRDIPAFDTVLFHSNLRSLRRKYLSNVPTDKIVLSSGAKISKRPLKRGHWWLKNEEGKCHFRFVERRFLAPLIAPEARKERSCQSFSASHKSGLPVSPPGLFPPCRKPLALAPLEPWMWPSNPWHGIHIDSAEIEKRDYFILDDAHSRWSFTCREIQRFHEQPLSYGNYLPNTECLFTLSAIKGLSFAAKDLRKLKMV